MNNTTSKKIYADGIYSINNLNYHESEGFSRSQLFLLEKSPYHFWHEVLSGQAEKKISTPAMNLGSAFHTLLLEPKKFDEEYCVLPDIDKRTSKGKEVWAEFTEKNLNKILLTPDQYEQILVMIENIKKHDIVNTILDNSLCEQSIYWTDKDTELQFKCRPDIWNGKMVVDLKTSSTENLINFSYSAINYGYYLQAAMIREAFAFIEHDIDLFGFLVCEKTAPYAPKLYVINEECLAYGKQQFNKLKTLLKQCIDTNTWPCYTIQEVTLPKHLNNLIGV